MCNETYLVLPSFCVRQEHGVVEVGITREQQGTVWVLLRAHTNVKWRSCSPISMAGLKLGVALLGLLAPKASMIYVML